MKILYLSRWYPFPPNNGSKLRIYNLLQGLKQQHDVTLLTFATPKEAHLHRAQPHPATEDLHIVPWQSYDPRRWRARLGYFSSMPRSVIDTYSREMVGKLRWLLGTTHFDLVIATQFDMAVYSPYFRHLPAILEEVEIGGLYESALAARSMWQRIRHRLTWFKHRCFLASLLANFRLCTVVSEREKKLLLACVNPMQQVKVVPNMIDVQRYTIKQPTKSTNTLIFTGAFSFAPNYAAMLWFVQEVFPLVRAKAPTVQLIITGDTDGKPLPDTAGVSRVGHVEDVASLVSTATISVAPILSGGGTRLKILEAMALRTPVVATTKGAEGLDVVHGKHLWIADTPYDFAAAILTLLSSPLLQRALAENAQRLVSAKYDTAVVVPAFLELLRPFESGKAQARFATEAAGE